MQWEVCLVGHEDILKMLDTVPQEDSLHIRYEHGRCYISSARFEKHDQAQAVFDEAAKLSSSLKGLLRLTSGKKHDLAVSVVTKRVKDGPDQDYAFFKEEMELRASLTVEVTYADGSVRTQGLEELFASKATLCATNLTVARVLEMYGEGTLDWPDLYRILEIILNDCGGPVGAEKLGWTTKKKIEQFNRTANDPKVAGNTARHGVFKNQSIKNPMHIRDGRGFIESLLHRWIGSRTT